MSDVQIFTRFTKEALAHVWLQPDVYSGSTDDLSPIREFAEVPDLNTHADVKAFLIVEDGEPKGFVRYNMRNHITWEAHAGFSRSFRGWKAKKACRLTMECMFKDGALKLILAVPRCHRHLQLMAYQLGFHREGVSTKAFLKDGHLVDLLYYGIEKHALPIWQ